MYFTVLFFVKVSILHLCVADFSYHYSKDPTLLPEIILLQSDNAVHKLLNDKFIKNCDFFYKITVNDSYNTIGIHETLKTIEDEKDNFRTVINLYVPDYNKYRIMTDNCEIGETVKYAGALTNTTTCTVGTRPQCYCGEIVKVISKTGMAKEIFDFVDSMQIIDERVHTREYCSSVLEHIEDFKTVLLCMEEIKEKIHVHIEPLKLNIRKMDECKANILVEYFPNVLAVLAPKPFEMDTEYSVPVVFYKTPYMCPKLTPTFLNSMTLSKWQHLKHVVVKFLNLMEWQRVAIVSDDAFYSIEFENELTTLFEKEKILYTVTRCDEANCDMKKITMFIQRSRATIVFVNINEDNATNLIKYSRNIVWLLRDKSETVKVSDEHQVFTFSLGASVEQSKNYGLNENILDGLSRISQTYKFMKYEGYEIRKPAFYRKFLEVMKMTSPPEAIAYVDKVNSRGSQRISSMHVTDDGAEVITFEDPYKGGDKPVDAPPCLARSFNFFKPCENTLVLLFMFVIISFSTTILLITCYFHKSSPYHDIRYQNFR